MVVNNSASEDAEGSEEARFREFEEGRSLLCTDRKVKRIVSCCSVESIIWIQLNWTYSWRRFPSRVLKMYSGYFLLPTVKCKKKKWTEERILKRRGTRTWWLGNSWLIQFPKGTEIDSFTARKACCREKVRNMAGHPFAKTSERFKKSEYSVTQRLFEEIKYVTHKFPQTSQVEMGLFREDLCISLFSSEVNSFQHTQDTYRVLKNFISVEILPCWI